MPLNPIENRKSKIENAPVHAAVLPDGAVPDTSALVRLIDATRRILRGSWVATGAGLTLGLLVGTTVALGLLDLLVPLWPTFRVLAFLAVVVPAGWVCYVGVVRPLFRRLRDGMVARRIESHLPGIHNRLVSCIDLENEERRSKVSPAFYRRLVQEALDRIRAFHPRQVVDFLSLRRAGIFAGTSTLAFFIAMALFHDRLPTALARIFAPLADIPPASSVKYQIVSPADPDQPPGDAHSLRGDDINFVVEVTKGEPEALVLEVTHDDGSEPVKKALVMQDQGFWKIPLTGYEKSFTYRIRGGGTWTKQHRVTIVDRPRIAELQVALHYPEYMGIVEPRLNPPQSADVTGPIDSQVEVVVRAEGEVKEAEVQLLEKRLVVEERSERPEQPWYTEKLPPGVNEQGAWVWEADNGRTYHTEPAAAGEHQHYFVGDPTGLPVKKTESLYAWVWIDPAQKPETILLQWNDGAGWEHRAFWGADKAQQGVAGTPSRFRVGDLPEAGKWHRLEVPAAEVGLEGATLRGMGFLLVGGQARWGAAGTLGPTRIEREDLVPIETFPLAAREDGRWAGRFPITRNGSYRVELRNMLGYANQRMKEGQIVAIPDNPPQVVLERPGSDITLTEPAKVPLVIAAYDDFGLKDVVLAVQRGDSGGFVSQTVKAYDQAARSDNVLAALDVPAHKLLPGEHLRYRLEVHDRKGQAAQTQEYVVRIANDESAADVQLARFEDNQDTFREKLVQLIAQQEKVSQQVEALEAKYEPLAQKIEQAQAAQEEKRPAPQEPAADPANPGQATTQPPKPPLELDEESKKLLEQLRQELAAIVQQEEQNAQLGEQVAADIERIAEEAERQQLLPQEMIDEIAQVQQNFDQNALQPMRDLAAELKQDAQPDPAEAPNLEELAQESGEVEANLEAIKERLDALAEARDEMKQDPNEAVAQLERELMRQDAGLTARDLQNLRDFLAAQLEELKRLSTDEEQIVASTETVPDKLLDALEQEQANLEQQANEELRETREIQQAAKPERMKRPPEFPDAPYNPENDEEYLIPPKEEDTEEPAGEPAEEDPAADAADEAEAEEGMEDEVEEDEEEELFMPALGGPQPKLDPRFAEKLRPVEKEDPAAGDEPATPEQARRQELGERGFQKLTELDLASQSVAADQEALDQLMQKLQEALGTDPPHDGQPEEAGEEQGEQPEGQQPENGQPENGQPENGQPENGQPQQGQGQGQPQNGQPQQNQDEAGEEGQEEPLSPELAAQLAELMNLPEMQQAMAMADRVRALRAGKAGEQQQASQTPRQAAPSKSPKGNLKGGLPPGGEATELAELDLETRTIIMKMQPRVREELLQGMREQGPAGYRKFIQDYFQKLTKVKTE
jgi:hypothetical protein